jgi:hypothetical protein
VQSGTPRLSPSPSASFNVIFTRCHIKRKLLGINIFTYILAALIIFFLGANAAFGPGWLGQGLGIEDVGTFTKVSDALPLNVDVSGPGYLL